MFNRMQKPQISKCSIIIDMKKNDFQEMSSLNLMRKAEKRK